MAKSIVITVKENGEEFDVTLKLMQDGLYAWDSDTYDGQMPAYTFALAIHYIFSIKNEVKGIILPFCSKDDATPELYRKERLEDYYVDLLKILYI